MINEWDQSQSDIKHVMNHSIKFHLHMIWYEHFTRLGSQSLKQNPKMSKKQNKIWISDANQLDLHQSPQDDHRKQIPINGLTIDSLMVIGNNCQ